MGAERRANDGPQVLLVRAAPEFDSRVACQPQKREQETGSRNRGVATARAIHCATASGNAITRRP